VVSSDQCGAAALLASLVCLGVLALLTALTFVVHHHWRRQLWRAALWRTASFSRSRSLYGVVAQTPALYCYENGYGHFQQYEWSVAHLCSAAALTLVVVSSKVQMDRPILLAISIGVSLYLNAKRGDGNATPTTTMLPHISNA